MTTTPLLAKTFSVEGRELLYQLKQPEFLEDLLRPVFVWGVGMGTLLLIASCLIKDSKLRVIALVIMLASTLAVIPYLRVRKRAADSAAGRAAPAAKIALLRHDTRWVFFTLAGLAAGTWIWGRKDRLGPVLTTATALAGLATTGAGIWLEAYDAGAMHSTAGSSTPVPRPTSAPHTPPPQQ